MLMFSPNIHLQKQTNKQTKKIRLRPIHKGKILSKKKKKKIEEAVRAARRGIIINKQR